MKINVTMKGTPEELNKVMSVMLEEGEKQSAEIDLEKIDYIDETLEEEPRKVPEIEDIVMQHLEDLAKSIDKQSFEEFGNRKDCTGDFKTEYDQGFCDGFDWAVEMLKREVGKQEVKVKLKDLVSSVEDSLEEYLPPVPDFIELTGNDNDKERIQDLIDVFYRHGLRWWDFAYSRQIASYFAFDGNYAKGIKILRKKKLPLK